jgi:hypothetical protein
MPLSACLTNFNVLAVGITQSANCGSAIFVNHPHLTTRQKDSDPITFFCHYLCGASSTSGQLAALAGGHLNIMNLKAYRNRLHRHCITDAGFTNWAAPHQSSYLYTQWGQYISFFAVSIVQQGYKTASVGVILNRCNFARNAIFIAFKIDYTVNPSGPATSKPAGGDTTMVPSAAFAQPSAK